MQTLPYTFSHLGGLFYAEARVSTWEHIFDLQIVLANWALWSTVGGGGYGQVVRWGS